MRIAAGPVEVVIKHIDVAKSRHHGLVCTMHIGNRNDAVDAVDRPVIGKRDRFFLY